jgi:hypothetical protein
LLWSAVALPIPRLRDYADFQSTITAGICDRRNGLHAVRGTDEMDKIETYRGFEIRAFEREQGRWRAEIRKADGSMLKILVGDSGHRTSITTSADTLTAETSIDEVKKAIDAGGLS